MNNPRRRAREWGITPGVLPIGRWNAITDVQGVKVGHVTLIEGEDVRTGITAILPHDANLFQDKVPAAIVVGNGFGKLTGSTQVNELGEIETPIVLTNTLSVPRATEAIIEWTLEQTGNNEEVSSVNPVVGETNDGYLNNIRKMAVTKEHVREGINRAATGEIQEGCVGAGTGTVCFGWKGGVGTSSRILPRNLSGYTVGALVQTNFGGVLQMDGIPVGKRLGQYYLKEQLNQPSTDGSIMIILATDAPLSDRNLKRIAKRGLVGLARTGASMSNGSGDYVIAFSTAAEVRRTPERRNQVWAYPEVPNALMSPLFESAIEATEEAIYNSLCMAETMTGYRGVTVPALPLPFVETNNL
ncbi:MAG TPA: P1 family peptidase [Anaerolineales bacterium]|nr:P1 family peptidase [Anaerolineales bacterium]